MVICICMLLIMKVNYKIYVQKITKHYNLCLFVCDMLQLQV